MRLTFRPLDPVFCGQIIKFLVWSERGDQYLSNDTKKFDKSLNFLPSRAQNVKQVKNENYMKFIQYNSFICHKLQEAR